MKEVDKFRFLRRSYFPDARPSTVYKCPRFDLNDQKQIEGAWETGDPEHIRRAIEAAVNGFRRRIWDLAPLPSVNGEFVFRCIKPQNFFDDYCMSIVLQDLCDTTGMGLARVMSPAPVGQKQPASPDVEFL